MVKLELDLISCANLKYIYIYIYMSMSKAFVPVKKWVDPVPIG